MQCPVCHTEVGPQSAFCNSCGATLTPAAAPAGATYSATPGYADVPPAYTAPSAGYAAAPPPGYPPPATYPAAAGSGLSETAAAAIAYITFIPAIIFLVIEPYNKIPLVRFHSFQSIGLAVVAFVAQLCITLLSIILAFVPGMGFLALLFSMLHLVLFLVFFLFWIMAILKASKGEWYKIPLIGDFAMKQARG